VEPGDSVVLTTVSGHDTASACGGLEAQSRYFDDVRALVRKARSTGKAIDALRTMPPPSAFAGFGFSEEWANSLRVVFGKLESAG
jgi:hypothetical protein